MGSNFADSGTDWEHIYAARDNAASDFEFTSWGMTV